MPKSQPKLIPIHPNGYFINAELIKYIESINACIRSSSEIRPAIRQLAEAEFVVSIYYDLLINVSETISERVKTRIGGPQVPTPLEVYTAMSLK